MKRTNSVIETSNNNSHILVNSGQFNQIGKTLVVLIPEITQYIKSGGSIDCYADLKKLFVISLFGSWKKVHYSAWDEVTSQLKGESLALLVEVMNSNQMDFPQFEFNGEFIGFVFGLFDVVEKKQWRLVKMVLYKLYQRIVPLRSIIRKYMLDFIKRVVKRSKPADPFAPATPTAPVQPPASTVNASQLLGTPKSTIPPWISQSQPKSTSSTNTQVSPIPVAHTQVTSIYLSSEEIAIYNGLGEVLDVLSSVVAGCILPLKKEFIGSHGLLYYVTSLHFNAALIDELTSVIALFHKVVAITLV